MALALCISAPCFITRRHQAKPASILPLWSWRVNLRCSRRLGIRCDAGDTPGPVVATNTVPASHTPSWVHVEPAKDAYAGWAPLDSDYDVDRRAGFLKIGAGVALAFAFSLVTYAAYSRSGNKQDVVYSVTTLQKEKDIPTRSDESVDGHNPLASDTSRTPSSNKSKQEFHGENPQPDVASTSGLHQKETAPGQGSFPNKDVEKYSDEENALTTASVSDSDVESSAEYGHSDLEEVDNKPTSPSEELKQPINDVLNPAPDVKEIDELSTDDKSNIDSSGSPISASDLAEPSADESDVYDSPSQSTSEINVLENEKEQSSEVSLGHYGSAESIRGPEESNDAEAKHEADPSAEIKKETFTVSASLVVPKGAAEDVLELLGLDTESEGVELDSSAPEPGQMKSLSVLETLSPSPGSEFWQSESVEYFGIPAPSAPSAAAQARPGSVVVPATVDREQEQAMAGLQALKVIEPDVDAGGICTRREYARWLIAITGTLARSPAQKVFPAMYIETVSELAFNDVVPEDPDFPFIQGLAEAGLISSNLSRHDSDENGRSTDGAIFLPDSPLCRQDLVSWKVALEGHSVQAIDKQKLRAQTGFIDFDRINEDALPFLAKDLAAGERSIISTTFGFTRRFQPGKPVTRGQAAIALVTGEAADALAEELTRVEAEELADAAVVAELALEVRARKHLDEYFETELKLEKDSRLSVETRLEQVKTELDRVMKERDDQRVSVESIQAAVQAEKDLLHRYKQDLDEQLQALTRYQVEVGIEKDRLETLRKKAEEGDQVLADKKVEVEVEKKALILARMWAEDEAKKARAHGKLLEEARKRWNTKGIQVRVDKDLDNDNIPALSWKYSGRDTTLNNFLQRPPVHDILEKAGNFKSRVVEKFFQLLEAIRRALSSVRRKIVDSYQVVKERGSESLHGVGGKAHVIQQDTFSAVSRKAREVKEATRSTVVGVSSSVTEGSKKIADRFRGEDVSRKAQEVQDATISTAVGVSSSVTEGTKKIADRFRGEDVSRKAQEVQDATMSAVAGVSSSVTEGTKKIADRFRGDDVSQKAQEVQDATMSTAVGVYSSVTEGTKKIADRFRGEDVSRKAQEVQDATMSAVAGVSSSVTEGTKKIADRFRGDDFSQKAQEVQDATISTAVGVSSSVTEGTKKFADRFRGEDVSRKAQEVQDATMSAVAGVSSSVTEGTKKIADGFRGEAQKLVGKFKS